jgi:hypothetical protein
MVVLLRIVFGAALVWVVKMARDNAHMGGAMGAFDSIYYIFGVFVLAVANALVWVSYFGNLMADEMVGDGSGMLDGPKKKKTGFARVMAWAVRFGGLAVLVGLGWWVWQNRVLFEPATDLVKAWRMGNAPWEVKEKEFTVVRVIDGENLSVKDTQGKAFTLRLAGLEAPSLSSYDREVRQLAEAGRDVLSSMVLSNAVSAEVTLTNASRVMLGFVRVEGTNVNAVLLGQGYAEFRPEYLGAASLRSRWEMLQVQRHRAGEPNDVAGLEP